jgi:CYTH domain-containing protein
MQRLSRKADINPQTRLITSIYLPEEEFALLAATLTGHRIKKLRHRLQAIGNADMCVDEFQDGLSGLILAEAQFDTDRELETFPMPEFAIREVTDDPRFTGGSRARNGLPEGP